jgi:hypothetical protein
VWVPTPPGALVPPSVELQAWRRRHASSRAAAPRLRVHYRSSACGTARAGQPARGYRGRPAVYAARTHIHTHTRTHTHTHKGTKAYRPVFMPVGTGDNQLCMSVWVPDGVYAGSLCGCPTAHTSRADRMTHPPVSGFGFRSGTNPETGGCDGRRGRFGPSVLVPSPSPSGERRRPARRMPMIRHVPNGGYRIHTRSRGEAASVRRV